MKTRFFLSFVLLTVLIANSNSIGQTIHYARKADKSTIFYLFKNKGFEHLNSKFDEFLKGYEEDYLGEDNVYDAFDVFSKADHSFEQLLNEWLKLYPSSCAAYTARAKYYCACAWQTQGRKWNLDRTGRAYEEMEKYFSLALDDIKEALKLNARLDVCYAMRIEVGMATVKEELMNKALSEALSFHPYAYRIRLQYLQALTPRWGGSYQNMQTFIDSCGKYAEHNSKLKELAASIPVEKARGYAYLGRYEHAVKMYTEALKYSSSPSYYIDRGDVYTQMHDYKSALTDYEQALKLCPNEPEYLEHKENVLSILNKLSRTQKMSDSRPVPNLESVTNQDQSLVNSRQEAIDHTKKAGEHLKAGRLNEAIAEYTEAIQLAPGDYTLYRNRGFCYLRLNNSDAALQDYLRVAELKPSERSVYFRITQIYADRGSYDEALNAINKAISTDPTDGEAYFYRSRVYERRGSNIEAVDDMKRSCDLGYEPACRTYKMGR